jgi:hypothetical protein
MATVGDVLIAPLTPINPWFYWGLYESTQDDTTVDYVGDHLVAMSGWILASTVHAASTGQVITPFKAMTDGLQIMRYIAQDAGMFSLPVILPVLATASAAGWIATAEQHGAVTPGVASGFGMPMTPELYSRGTSSDPLGIRRDLRDMFGFN